MHMRTSRITEFLLWAHQEGLITAKQVAEGEVIVEHSRWCGRGRTSTVGMCRCKPRALHIGERRIPYGTMPRKLRLPKRRDCPCDER